MRFFIPMMQKLFSQSDCQQTLLGITLHGNRRSMLFTVRSAYILAENVELLKENGGQCSRANRGARDIWSCMEGTCSSENKDLYLENSY